MLKRLFGNYLVHKNLMTQEQLDALLPVSKDFRAEVDTIAVITKALLPAVVGELLEKVGKSAPSFGEAAIEAGYLTEDKLDELMVYQTNRFMTFVQKIMNEGLISLRQVNPLLDEFQEQSGFTDTQMANLVFDDLEQCVNMFVPLKSVPLKDLTITLIQTMRRLIDADLYLEKAYTTRSIQLDKYACQAIIGDFRVKVYMTASEDGLLGIANYFSQDTYPSVTEDALDNVCEFINCANGLFATNSSYDDLSVDMNSPEYSLEGVFLSNEKLYVIPIYANGYCFKAVLEVYD